eukprot:gene24559-30919_t
MESQNSSVRNRLLASSDRESLLNSSWLGDPAIYVLDCSGAGMLLPHLVDNMSGKTSGGGILKGDEASFRSSGFEGPTIVLASCKADEILPMNPQYPADIFTACLTTPIVIAIRWFVLQNPYTMRDINPEIAENIPGKDNDRKTPRGELNWIFTAITDTIAWNTLPSKTFQKMFRQDLLVASLFRNFLLAKRIMKSFNCTPQSWPQLPDSTNHHLWQSWDLTLESFIMYNVALIKGTGLVDHRNNMGFASANPSGAGAVTSNLSFFTDQLTAFELWLDFGHALSEPPAHLPIVLQVLLSQTHRLRALLLLKRYLALGSEAVNLSLMVGIFPYILKLLQSPADDIKQILVSIWASIIGFDSSCRQELVREKAQSYFIQYLIASNMPAGYRCLAAFVLAEICNENKDGQQTCLQLGLHRSCTVILTQEDLLASGSLKRWVCLCLHKLCDNFLWAKFLCVTEALHVHLYPLLQDKDPTVRAAALLALGEMFGASALRVVQPPSGASSRPSLERQNSYSSDERRGDASSMDEKDLREAEMLLAMQILDCCTDGSMIVRQEAIHALSKFFVQNAHIDYIKFVAKHVGKIFDNKVHQATHHHPRKSQSPGVEGGERVSSAHSKANLYPWHLSTADSQNVTVLLSNFIESRASTAGSAPSVPVEGGAATTQLASCYLRLWLALTEVEGKDPCRNVANGAGTIRNQINAAVTAEEQAYNMQIITGMSSHSESTRTGNFLAGSFESSSFLESGDMAAASPFSNSAQFSYGTPGNNNMLNSRSGDVRDNGARRPPPSPFLGGQALGSQTPSSARSNVGMSMSPAPTQMNSSSRDINELAADEPAATSFTSNYYAMTKRLFLSPDIGYDPFTDPLSIDGRSRTFRNAKQLEIVANEAYLTSVFKDVENRSDEQQQFQSSRNTPGGSASKTSSKQNADDSDQAAKSSAVTALPPHVSKFEQKAVMNMENTQMTSLIMFHAFQDVLAVCDGASVGIWSLNTCTRIMDIKCNKPVKDPVSLKDHAPVSHVTSMTWINESYDALLLTGSDDGVVKVWRDTSSSDVLATHVNGGGRDSSANIREGINGFTLNSSQGVSSAEMVSTFCGLPDVAETSRGSGIMMSWRQSTGSLVVGGNSSSIRLWDVGREQCARVFYSGSDTCLTAVATTSVPASSTGRPSADTKGDDSAHMSWIFAGFADGSIGAFDERVYTNGGKVHQARDHSAWIISAHLRADVPEVITASVRGTVKFWDLRTMRTYKTLEVQKSPLTALAVHNCAPIMATGSHAQFIKILTLNGDQLGNIIKYHEGFLGQRIGPVSCLTFHPYRMMLAASFTDSIVSIYSTSDNHHHN